MSPLKVYTSFKPLQEIGLIEFQGKLHVDEDKQKFQHLGVLSQNQSMQRIWNMQTGKYVVAGRHKPVTKACVVLKKISSRHIASFSIVGLVKEQIECCERPCPLISYKAKKPAD
uniref:Uncharacterized protein n=1 Tax=Micromonas pusilla TaxID=38833 RepID=A0A6U2DRU3_MICPS|mmetsp:Transcript_7031/g.27668  ORF Transcript_7031/g.27668 Transcript_7031/m.27668 type:complete len:114 (+) Transcript_7031:120-461(+)